MDHRVHVTVSATLKRAGTDPSVVHTLEGQMPLTGLLNALDLAEAVKYFLQHTHIAGTVDQVHSFKIEGHEMLGTFIRRGSDGR